MGNRNTSISYRVPISVKGIVFEGDLVWLRKNQRNEWELPGGKMDKGEQPDKTVIRELKEELGFDVEPIKVVHAYTHIIKDSQDESRGVLIVSYLCRLNGKSGNFEIEGEAGKAEFKKFSLSEIERLNMPDFYKEAIRLGQNELNKH